MLSTCLTAWLSFGVFKGCLLLLLVVYKAIGLVGLDRLVYLNFTLWYLGLRLL